MYFPKIRKPRAILFDLGDTLINHSATNPLPYIEESTRRAYDFIAGTGVRLPGFKTYFRCCRQSAYLAFLRAELLRREVNLLQAMRIAHRRLRLPCEDEFLLATASCFYGPIKSLGQVEENIHRVLGEFQETGHPMAIVSNTMVPGKVLDQHLDEEGLLPFFPVRVYSSDVGVKKPKAVMFLTALRALNAKPQGALFVGDKPRLDIKGAARVGMTTVLKVRKAPPRRYGNKPDYVIQRLTELPALLNKIGRWIDDYDLSPSALPDPSEHRLGFFDDAGGLVPFATQ